MESELEKFHEESGKKKDLKLLIDFEPTEKTPKINQIEIGDIKYKERKIKEKNIVDLKDRNKKDNNSLF
jgi:mannose/fructose/N-acetylgalactosamine-specific phosphotransferase system component IIB